jgi:hypothetical protein
MKEQISTAKLGETIRRLLELLWNVNGKLSNFVEQGTKQEADIRPADEIFHLS